MVPLQKYTAVNNLELLKIPKLECSNLSKLEHSKYTQIWDTKVHTNLGYTKYKWTTSTSQYRIALLRPTGSTTGTSTGFYLYKYQISIEIKY
eukprot:SAG11_NODE_1081_length_5956_cov_14.482506_2_plen_92_part_00